MKPAHKSPNKHDKHDKHSLKKHQIPGAIEKCEADPNHPDSYVINTTPNSFLSGIKGAKGNSFGGISSDLMQERYYNRVQCRKTPRSVEAFFIGPRGENTDYFSRLIDQAIQSHHTARIDYEHEDYRHTKKTMKNEPSFLDAQDAMERSFNYLCTKLRDLSPPFYSSRYYGHMNWETTIPSLLGNFATLLYNPNNCAFEGGPFTTQLEIDCMGEFAKLFHYPEMFTGELEEGCSYSWGHFTCGGTVANCESFWAARQVKFLAFSLRELILKQLTAEEAAKVRDMQVTLPNGKPKKLLELTTWEILNVPNDETMRLNDVIFKTVYPNQPEKYSEFQNRISSHTIGKAGVANIYYGLEDMNRENPDKLWAKGRVPSPLSFVSATVHYSIPKSTSLLGFGEGCVQKVEVDLNTRVNTQILEQKLEECLAKHIPVLSVVGIVGSTEESTVDNLKEILAIKARMAQKGLFFHFHIDGAYGAYFVSMIREIQQGQINSFSEYVREQLSQFQYADSITFDPHKTGYVPYCCGGIFYRNHLLRNNLSFSAPYIFSGLEPNVAIYGIEGSKPGNAVASVYMSLATLPLERSGHGELLERTMRNTKIFSASLYLLEHRFYNHLLSNGQRLSQQHFKSQLLPLNYLDKYPGKGKNAEMMAAYRTIATTTPTSIEQMLEEHPCYQKYYYELGPDLNILCYNVNYIDKKTGTWNTSLSKLNAFNRKVVELSKPVGSDTTVRNKSLYVSDTEISVKYGKAVLEDFLKRYGLVDDGGSNDIVFIRSTIMNAFFTEQNQHTGCPNEIFLRELAEVCCEAMLELGLL